MWDDYYEPTEFDEAMMEFKASIVDNVRQEIKNKIDRLEKENAELREVKNNWKHIQAEHERQCASFAVKKSKQKNRQNKPGYKRYSVIYALPVIGLDMSI